MGVVAARGRVAAQRSAGPPSAVSLLVLLGTQGGPGVNLARGQSGNALIVNGAPYLIDCGYGTVRALTAAGVRYTDVGTVCITHLHNDHTADLAALLSLQWTGARATRTTVYGPHGTVSMVEGALAFFRGDTEVRTIDEGRTVTPASLFAGRDVPAAATPVEVLRDGAVVIRAVENAHYLEQARSRMAHRSLSYRFDTPDRSFVFSGDTSYSTNLVSLARDADVFVCEAMEVGQQRRLLAQANLAGPGASVARHVAESHVTTEDVGRMAAEARVKMVVLTHLSPGANAGPAGEPTDTTYIAGVRKHYAGQVVVGRDGMRL